MNAHIQAAGRGLPALKRQTGSLRHSTRTTASVKQASMVVVSTRDVPPARQEHIRRTLQTTTYRTVYCARQANTQILRAMTMSPTVWTVRLELMLDLLEVWNAKSVLLDQ